MTAPHPRCLRRQGGCNEGEGSVAEPLRPHLTELKRMLTNGLKSSPTQAAAPWPYLAAHSPAPG